jgi:hypothetical protein
VVSGLSKQAHRLSERPMPQRTPIVRAIRQRVTTLDNERQQLLARIQQLEERIEVLYAELYAKRLELPHDDR